MADRTVTDSTGRTWTCTSTDASDGSTAAMGQDVLLSCTSPTVEGPIELKVGWQWEKMAGTGLARMINLRSPVPRNLA